MNQKIYLLFSTVVLLLMVAACSQPAPIADSPEARLAQARALTELEVESGALDDMLDEGAALAREATADMLMLEFEREPTDDELAELEAVLRSVMAEFLTAEAWQATVAEVYAADFTAAELQETVAFYTSPVGRKILGRQRALDEEVGRRAEALIDERLDEFAARVDEVLAERFPELGGVE
jgi:hypothetical protein